MLEAAIQGDWSGIENGGTAKAYTEWQTTQAHRPPPTPPPSRAPVEADPAPNYAFLAEQQAREQAALDAQNADWQQAHVLAA